MVAISKKVIPQRKLWINQEQPKVHVVVGSVDDKFLNNIKPKMLLRE